MRVAATSVGVLGDDRVAAKVADLVREMATEAQVGNGDR